MTQSPSSCTSKSSQVKSTRVFTKRCSESREADICRTLSRFHGEDIYVSSLFHGVGIFLFSFAGSMFLGVAFGLCCSLGLKHSHLASYPHIESCIVALVAYTSYFFSNGLSMSGESFCFSSLLFPLSPHLVLLLVLLSATLKIIMTALSARTRLTNRNRISLILRNHTQTLRLSYNVETDPKNYEIHVCCPRSAFGEFHLYLPRVESLYAGCSGVQAFVHSCLCREYPFLPMKQLPIGCCHSLARSLANAQIAVMASRYAAVFPLSELINWIYQYRGQRHEELPHSYQMMLFWAGLRGAVGVALAAGITGDNADALRTTILVVVVLTVIVFGGTTARMLEVLGIRVGVEDEDASSDEDEGWTSHHGNLALSMGPGSRRYAGQNGRGLGGGGYEASELDLHSPAGSPYLGPSGSGGMKMPLRNTRPAYAGNHASRSGFTNSDDESEDEALPSATLGENHDSNQDSSMPGMVFRDGQWFTALDERYLLPLFSNSVTARRHLAKKARKASVYNGGESSGGTPRGGNSLELQREEEGDGESENGKNKVNRTFR